MGQRRPSVREGMLYPSVEDTTLAGTISLGSVAWYSWLEQHSIFCYDIPFAHYTARKERRSGGWYWYAYRRQQGKLRTAYLGKSRELTLERLNTVAGVLRQSDESANLNDDISPAAPSTAHGPFPSFDPPANPKTASPPPPPPPLAHPALPVPLTPLIGREQDVASTAALLRRPEVRLVNLIGMGGVGKTRLALQVASDLRPHFADGVYFVALAPVRDPQLALSTIAQALGLKEELNVPLADLLKGYLRSRDLLLVLDNFEQIMPAAPLLVDLLTSSPRLKLLVTSREILHVCGEYHVPVAPLAFPGPDHLLSFDSLVDYPAVSLFLQRAQATIPDMATNPATIHAIAQVCARLEGLPLAIELAAARVRLLPPQALVTRLGRRLDVLTQGGPDMPTRHQTLRATFNWSRDLLSAEEQTVFRRLSVFVGGCTLEAAEAVCGSEGEAADPFISVVSSLVDKSLLQASSRDEKEPRLYLLDTVREYALECLAESGELESTQEAHAAYYLSYAEEAEPQLYRHEQYHWLERLDRENENLRAAFSFLLAFGGERALRLTGALGWFWYMRGRLSEGLDWSDQALKELPEGSMHPTGRKALVAAGLFANYLGQRGRARTWLKSSLELARSAGDTQGFAKAAFALTHLDLVDGDVASAQVYSQEALSFVQGTEDPWTLATVFNLLGLVTMCTGDLLGAGVLCERSMALFAEAGDMHMRDQVLLTVGNALLAQGEEAKARNLIEELIVGSDAGHSFWMAGWLLCAYGEIALQQGDGSRARFLLEQALAQSRRMGNQQGVARACSLLAQVALLVGDADRAQSLGTQSLQIAAAAGDKETIVSCLEGMADIAARQGQAVWAVTLWGAGDRQRRLAGIQRSAVEAVRRRPLLEAARKSLGETLFHATWAAGRSLTPEQALVAPETAGTSMPTASVAPALSQGSSAASRPAGLTKRELEALLLVAEGLTNDEIAGRLVVSTATVKTYLSAIYTKLGVSTRTAAMRYAIDHRLHAVAPFSPGSIHS